MHDKIYRSSFIGCLFLFVAVSSQAQEPAAAKAKLMATTSLGVSFPQKGFANYSNNGFRTMTGLEYQPASGGLMLRMAYELTLYPFDNQRSENGYLITNKGSRSLLGGYIDVGYRQAFGKSALYLFAGAGGLVLVYPQTALNDQAKTIRTETRSKLFAAFHGGVGFEMPFAVFGFRPYLEGQYFGLGEKTPIYNTRLTGYNIGIGFKTAIRKRSHSSIN